MKQRGFTLLELMLAISVAAILAAIGVPAMGTFIKNSRMTTTVNDFIASVTVARSEAAKRRSPVTLCISKNALAVAPDCSTAADASWDDGWIVFTDDDGDAEFDGGEVLLHQQGPTTNVSVSADNVFATYVSFSGLGETRNTAGDSVTGDLLFCDERGIVDLGGGMSAARGLNIARTGRARSLNSQSDITGLGLACP